MGIAMGMSFLTSTHVRAEAGLTQAKDSPMVDEPQDWPKCHHLPDGMCVTHGKQATDMFKPSWVTNSGPGGKNRKQYKRIY